MKKLLLIGLLIFNACNPARKGYTFKDKPLLYLGGMPSTPFPDSVTEKWRDATQATRGIGLTITPGTAVFRAGGMRGIVCAVYHADGHCSWYDDVDTLPVQKFGTQLPIIFYLDTIPVDSIVNGDLWLVDSTSNWSIIGDAGIIEDKKCLRKKESPAD